MAPLELFLRHTGTVGLAPLACCLPMLSLAVWARFRVAVFSHRESAGLCPSCGHARERNMTDECRCTECGRSMQLLAAASHSGRYRRSSHLLIVATAACATVSMTGIWAEGLVFSQLSDRQLLSIKSGAIPTPAPTRELAARELVSRAASDTLSSDAALQIWIEVATYWLLSGALVKVEDDRNGGSEPRLWLLVPPWPTDLRPNSIALCLRNSRGDLVARRDLVPDPRRHAKASRSAVVNFPTPTPDLIQVGHALSGDEAIVLTLECTGGEILWRSEWVHPNKDTIRQSHSEGDAKTTGR